MISIVKHNPGTDMQPYVLARLEPPEHLMIDSRAKDGAKFWQYVINALYTRFNEDKPNPDTDSEFVEWLTDGGWTVLSDDIQVHIGEPS